MNVLTQFEFIDIHYHASPDLYKRKLNVFEAGKIYKKLKGAVVLKSHLGSTAIQATLAQQMALPVFASLVLNNIAGGICYRAILQALAEYQPIMPAKLIVHFPTITGRKHQSKLQREMANKIWQEQISRPETLFNEQSKLRTEVIDLLKLARDYPIVLSTGHASKAEVYALIDACLQYNVPALLLNQPVNPMTGLNAEELLAISKHAFVWVEQTALTLLLGYQSHDDFSKVMRDVPRVIYSSDLGQTNQISIDDWYKLSQRLFSTLTISSQRKVELCLTNPLQLLKI